MKRLLMAAALLLAAAGPAQAEKADMYKTTDIAFGALKMDDVKQVTVLSNGVNVQRGTLAISAARGFMKALPDGSRQFTLFGDGKIATFRQKRDGAGDQWIDGEAERIDYDEKTEVVTLVGKAAARRSIGGKPGDEVQGEFIAYDSRRESYSVANSTTGESKAGAGRGHLVLQPIRTEPENK